MQTDAAAGDNQTNGRVEQVNGNDNKSDGVKSNKTKPRSNSKPLRVLHAPPPEFHPSEPSSTPLSANSSQMFYPPAAPMHDNGYHAGYAPQMPPRPFSMAGFNPEAVFQPLNHVPPQMSRTPSHTSSAGRPVSGIDMQSPAMPMPNNAIQEIRMTAAATLQDYALSTFDSPEMSDLTIAFAPSHDRSNSRAIRAHTFIARRSPKLWDLVAELKKPSQTIVVEAPSHAMTETGFLGALKYLYGAPLWYPETLFGELGQFSPRFLHGAPSADVMPQVLSYIASGHFLGLPEVVQAGLTCVRRLQTWDTVEQCLAFGLEGGISTSFWSHISSAVSSTTDNFAREPTYGQAASYILHDTLLWIALAFPTPFHFSPSATQLADAPRLPTVVENRPSQADPRLSLIQFGDMALEETGRPDYLTARISSILLSLPFAALNFLFEQPAWRQKPLNHQMIAEATIQERENRRNAVLSAKRLKDAEKLWEATKWIESVAVESSHGYAAFHLRREKAADAGA